MRSLVALLLACSVLLPLPAAAQTTKLRVATCARTITAGLGAPFAVATKMGWFKQEGIDVEIVPLPARPIAGRPSPPGRSRSRCRASSRWRS
jgi:NitT/TauT family transport system substrate-binding protein